jgi:hypothetical protein
MSLDKLLYQEIGQQRTCNLINHYKIKDMQNKIQELEQQNVNYMSIIIANSHNTAATNFCFRQTVSDYDELLQKYNNLKSRHEKLLKKK